MIKHLLRLSFIQKKKNYHKSKKLFQKFVRVFFSVQELIKTNTIIDSLITIRLILTFNILLQISVGWLGKWIDRDLPYRFQQMAPRIPATLLRLLRVRLAKSNEARTRFICRSSSLPNIDRFLSVSVDGS